MLNNYSHCYQNSIISSKLVLKKQYNFPKIIKIVIFFIVNAKYYNKSILLLYLLIQLCFFAVLLLYNREIKNYQVLKLSLQKKKIIHFLNNFTVVYLPIFDTGHNVIKKSTSNILKKKNLLLYRIFYYVFPLVPEVDFLFYSNEYIYNIINICQVVLDFYLKNNYFFKNTLDFLLRIYRLPFTVRT
jgi:hypothetical protein